MEEGEHVVEEATGQTVPVRKKGRKRKREIQEPPLVVIGGGEEGDEPLEKKVRYWVYDNF